MESPPTHGLVDRLFRERSGQMVAWLTRLFGPAHLELAEEVVQDALLKALQQWPFTGVPANPGGWLFQVARNGALDALRRGSWVRARSEHIAAELSRSAELGVRRDATPDDLVQDDELQMIFLCCHPALSRDAQVALSLKTVGGFSVPEIARAFLASETAVAQRLVRAKRQLRAADASFALPSGGDLAERLETVLEVIYLLFNEGYAAGHGDALVRADLCGEALRLARIVADRAATARPEADALVALVALQSARLGARVDAAGDVVLLDEQDRSAWDPRLIALGFRYLDRSASGTRMTTYHVQAAIAAAHAGSAHAVDTPWPAILALYDDLMAIGPSPLVALNRAVAVWKVHGAPAALAALGALEAAGTLRDYYLLPAVKGRLLAADGQTDAARQAFEAALHLPCSGPERRLIRRRLQALVRGS